MRSWGLARFMLTGCAAAALLPGCGGARQGQSGAPSIGEPGVLPQSSSLVATSTSATYKIVYRFGSARNGADPNAGLIDVDGKLYGTTSEGGAGPCRVNNKRGCGTVFSLTTGGKEKVIYSFGASPDGNHPYASLIDVGGTLYGTTKDGGSHNLGTVFSVTPAGVEKVLYSFSGSPDGGNPVASLTNVGGTLYGTTYGGGAHRGGSAFRITTSGVEKVIDSFGGTRGGYPVAGLLSVGNDLFGSTSAGCGGRIFRLTPSGGKKYLFCFRPESRGTHPQASLINVNGTLYGTTYYGGTFRACTSGFTPGCGTVFSITPSGTEQVIYSFGGGSDGNYPKAPLVELDGTLYGTTSWGGGHRGTIFSVTPSGTETVLHIFTAGSDGANPVAGLINVKGTLYGTTSQGGGSNCSVGCGTVFAIKP